MNERPPEIPRKFWEELEPGAKERTVDAKAVGPDGSIYFYIGVVDSSGEGGGSFIVQVKDGVPKMITGGGGAPNLSEVGIPQSVADSFAEQELATRLEKGGPGLFHRLRDSIMQEYQEALQQGYSTGELADPAYVKAYKKFGLVRSDFSPPPPPIFKDGRYVPQQPAGGENRKK
ncbi:hypothetical protein [Methylacidimicrobium sp. AP8]|uniref:hypothetical protein n=1 Tax=Methylacidimicrobium sp. AP8 TaxID=2730359 RepID=UPI001921F535|nr:hypothetical protein [Methylacidimicrobium sp. AP8]